MLKKSIAPIMLALTLVFMAACSRSPVMKLYDGPKKPEAELAIIRVPVELEVLSINGRRIEGVNSLFSIGYKDLHLEPGEYRILAYYKDLWDMNADAHDVIKSDPALFPVDAQAGHFYRLGFDEPQNIEQARELEKAFSGYTLDVSTGEKIPSQPSGVAFRSGLLGSIGDIAGADTTTAASAEKSGDNGQVVTPLAKRESVGAATGSDTPDDGGYLEMLKAYWSQATKEERRQFLRWISEQK